MSPEGNFYNHNTLLATDWNILSINITHSNYLYYASTSLVNWQRIFNVLFAMCITDYDHTQVVSLTSYNARSKWPPPASAGYVILKLSSNHQIDSKSQYHTTGA